MRSAAARVWDYYDEDDDDFGLEAEIDALPEQVILDEFDDEEEDEFEQEEIELPRPLKHPQFFPAPSPVFTQRFDASQRRRNSLTPAAPSQQWFGNRHEELLLETELYDDDDYGYDYQPRQSTLLFEKALRIGRQVINNQWVVLSVVLVGGCLLISLVFGWLKRGDEASIYQFGVIMQPKAGIPNDQDKASAPPVNTSNSHGIEGTPTISVAKIEQVLRQYKSPAVGASQGMYDLGIKYGIDPAYALAFFIHESSAGTKGLAVTTKSIGNIRQTANSGFEAYQGFRKYPTWEAGMEDWYKLIKELYVKGWKLRTIEAIVPKYAPSIENDTNNYINQVVRLVEDWRKSN